MTTDIKKFAEAYAQALLSYSAEEIAKHYRVPLAVYSDLGVQLVDKEADVVAFWEQGVQQYKGMNVAKAEPHIISQDQLSESIMTAKILWKNYDSAGNEAGSETNFYILSTVEGQTKISGLVIMGK